MSAIQWAPPQAIFPFQMFFRVSGCAEWCSLSEMMNSRFTGIQSRQICAELIFSSNSESWPRFPCSLHPRDQSSPPSVQPTVYSDPHQISINGVEHKDGGNIRVGNWMNFLIGIASSSDWEGSWPISHLPQPVNTISPWSEIPCKTIWLHPLEICEDKWDRRTDQRHNSPYSIWLHRKIYHATLPPWVYCSRLELFSSYALLRRLRRH